MNFFQTLLTDFWEFTVYCVEEAWSKALADGKDPNRKLMQYDMAKLRAGFDFAAWLPARCADRYRRKRTDD